MSAYKVGTVKWFRNDGTGYIISDEMPDESILVDSSVVSSKHRRPNSPLLEKGQKVKFKEKLVLGRRVAIDVKPA